MKIGGVFKMLYFCSGSLLCQEIFHDLFANNKAICLMPLKSTKTESDIFNEDRSIIILI